MAMNMMSVGALSASFVLRSAKMVVFNSRFPVSGVGLIPRGVNMCTVVAATSKKTETETTTKKREPRGIMKPRPVSPEMQAVVGVSEIPRTQALKLIWAYIKENNLQDPENKKIIICDEKLKKIFKGNERVGFLEVAGLISPHFL
ncbi:Upstream activation factor subunit spp27 [Heracleum sosnowskyi]|uniref:Upstream activation factor subunit spp27 n=1 Tax=Heracleum sosnowskyi TaxID=360622 RepID=A0AAD8H122_9APIA|nr:Upstream activation factor subunit spp27 [Heracleum sosnowskyi]